MLHSKNFDFSFSGLKTAVLYLIKKIGILNQETKSKIALEFENAVIETLVYKTMKAKKTYNAKTIIIAGGVACNTHLQREMKRVIGKETILLFPEKELATDNSIMIGMAGYLQFIKNKGKVVKVSSIKAIGNLHFK
jgi:N6-L-threonylcarbamoyladenine synthase